MEEHFSEQIAVFNKVVFDNGQRHAVKRADVFSLRPRGVDLVYLDPHVTAYGRPHRYHFGTHSQVERAQVREYLIVGQ